MRIHPAAQENLQELGIDAEDEALLDHVLGDDEPPQGLHRGGFGVPTEEEEDWVAEYRYGYDDIEPELIL